jgi:hypothetical protein
VKDARRVADVFLTAVRSPHSVHASPIYSCTVLTSSVGDKRIITWSLKLVQVEKKRTECECVAFYFFTPVCTHAIPPHRYRHAPPSPSNPPPIAMPASAIIQVKSIWLWKHRTDTTRYWYDGHPRGSCPVVGSSRRSTGHKSCVSSQLGMDPRKIKKGGETYSSTAQVRDCDFVEIEAGKYAPRFEHPTPCA